MDVAPTPTPVVVETFTSAPVPVGVLRPESRRRNTRLVRLDAEKLLSSAERAERLGVR
eukprot:IDg14365t1